MTHIFYSSISKEKHMILLDKFLTSFSPDFQKRVHNYRRWEDAQVSVLGRLLLRYGLTKTDYDSAEEIYCNEYNKPFFKYQNLEFNISHSKDIVVCVISDECEIGVDVEYLEDINISDFKFQMTPKEWNRISFSDNPRNEFFDYWTQKEALIKAYGMGLSMPLNSFEITNKYSRIGMDDFFLEEILIEKKYKCYIAFQGKPGQCKSMSKKEVSIASLMRALD